MISKKIIVQHKLTITILLFIAIFSGIHYSKPSLLYMPDGSFRQFGVGYKNKTVISIWVVSILLAILCYVAVSYYLLYSN